MGLKDTINADLKSALLGGDHFKVNVLRGAKAEILNEEVKLGKRDDGLADPEIEKVLAREVKKRKEAAEIYTKANDKDRAETELKESEILQTYLPQMATEDELRVAVKAKIAELGATDMKQMGQVIGAVKAQFGTSADGATLSQIVKSELLTK